MTSPNRETEAQQAENQVEQIVLTKAKASLMIKRGKIKSSEARRILSQEARERETAGSSSPEKVTEKILSQEPTEMAHREASNPEQKETGNSSPAVQEVQRGISGQGPTEMVHPEALNPEQKETGNSSPAIQEVQKEIPGQEPTEMVHPEALSLEQKVTGNSSQGRRDQVTTTISNRDHPALSKKAAPGMYLQEKSAVILKKTISIPKVISLSGNSMIKKLAYPEVQTAVLSEKETIPNLLRTEASA